MDYYNEIKNELLNNEINKKVKDYSKNRHELETYYNIGKLLIEAQGGEKRAKYGDGLIKEYSKKLNEDIGLNLKSRILWRSRQFYLLFSNEKVSTMSTLLTWSHYVELLKFNDISKVEYYIKVCENENLSVRDLRNRIKSNEYERLPIKTKEKLVRKENIEIQDFIKNPIMIKNIHNYEMVSEKALQKLILEDIPSFLDELGEGFTFIKNEYKIKIGSRYNYIDLLLFNIKYNCYCVVELKVTELEKEHIGQIQVYMNYIDKKIKTFYQNKTIGIIICYKNNKFIIEYSSDNRIFSTEYELIG